MVTKHFLLGAHLTCFEGHWTKCLISKLTYLQGSIFPVVRSSQKTTISHGRLR